MAIDKREFSLVLNSINRCYAQEYQQNLPKPEDFLFDLFDEDDRLNIERLIDFSNNQDNIYIKSVSNRIAAINQIQESRESETDLDILSTWKFVLESILILPTGSIISSIGSQGFLSIPLYKKDEDIKNFEFIRLHVWDNSLQQYINQDTCNNFSIHSHTFFAHSWIIYGKVLNARYSVNISPNITNNALFTIQYDESVNKISQHSSNAINSGVYVKVNQLTHEVYMQGSSYMIKEGDYHKSGSLNENGLSATFFSFTARNGLSNKSYVVGPSEIHNSEINRKIHSDSNELLLILNNKIHNND